MPCPLPSNLPTDSEVCSTNQSSDTADDAVDGFDRFASWLPASDWPVVAPKIESLFELTQMAEPGRPDNEFWEWVVIAAANELAYDLFSEPARAGMSAFEKAKTALSIRRAEKWDWRNNGAFQDQEICDEINLFLKRVFHSHTKETDMVATKRKPATNGHVNKFDPDEIAKFEDEAKPTVDQIRDQQFAALKRNGKSRAKEPAPPTGTAQIKNASLLKQCLLDLQWIVDSPFQRRNEPSDESIAELGESLLRDGQRDAIKVRFIEATQKYELLGGHRRTRAARRIGWSQILAIEIQCDDAEASRLVWDDNEQREDLNEIERAKMLLASWEQYQKQGKTMREMADEFGIEQGTISNRIGLLSAPESLQQRLISGEIKEYRLRTLAKWAKYEGLLPAFESELNNRCSEGPVNLNHWASALVAAINRVSKPMRKANWDKDPARHFEPTPEQLKELDVVEVKIEGHWDNGSEKRAFNVKLWNRLQNEAKKKKASRQAAKAAKEISEPATAKKPQRTNRDTYPFRPMLQQAWLDPLWEKFESWMQTGKKTKPQKCQLARLLSLYQPNAEFIASTITMSADEYAEACIADMNTNNKHFHIGDLEPNEIEQITSAFGIEIVSTWKPTKELLDVCELIDLHDIADDINVEKIRDKVDLIELLIECWPAGHVPELLALHPPKKAPKAKAKK